MVLRVMVVNEQPWPGVVQPIGGEGVIVAASGTQRGFTPADQAWIAVVAEKLDQTLSGEERA